MAESAARKAYMGKAEEVLRKYAGEHPLLAVWRCEAPKPRHPDITVDMILVGMPDEANLDEPSELIVFRTYLVGNELAFVELIAGEDSEFSYTPFSGGHSPIEMVIELAKKLPNL